ncbi:MAG: response regulator transcription factor [Erysipelotrichaceae bacterium]
MKILIAEDETQIARGLKYILEKNKYTVDIAPDGQQAVYYLENYEYDAVVLDVMMPYKSGIEVLKWARGKGLSVPIMILSAKAELEDRIEGLDEGADDYLPKPFVSREFVSRVRALCRRNQSFAKPRLSMGNTCLDRNTYELVCGDKSIKLNNKEFQILELFRLYTTMCG